MAGYILASYRTGFPGGLPSAPEFMDELLLSERKEEMVVTIHLKHMPSQLENLAPCVHGKTPIESFWIQKATQFGLTVYYANVPVIGQDPVCDSLGPDGHIFIPFSNIAAISTRVE